MDVRHGHNSLHVQIFLMVEEQVCNAEDANSKIT